MKVVCAFLMCLNMANPIMASPNMTYRNVDRAKLNYEVLSIDFTSQELVITGWAGMPHVQHFYGKDTHSYALDVVGDTHSFTVNGTIQNKDITRFIDHRGWPRCKSNAISAQSCNYDMKNLGFEFRVKLNDLKVGEDYKLFLKMHAKQSDLKYRIPVFYVEKAEKFAEVGRRHYSISSSFKHTAFKVYLDKHIVRTLPSPVSSQLKLGSSCSNTHKNNAYFKHQSTYDNILDIATYNNLVTYFKLPIKNYGCVENRRNVIQAKESTLYGYVPSTAVSYLGEPTTIIVRQKSSKPILLVEDVSLYENDPYSPLDYAKACDLYDGDLTNKIKVSRSNVNTSIPGVYSTCYVVTNSSNNKTEECGQVNVKKRPRTQRYVSTYSIHNTNVILWDKTLLKDKLRSEDITTRIIIDR